MILNGNCVYLSSEKKPGIKDPTKTYCNALLMQGTQPMNCSVPEPLFNGELAKIPQYSPVYCEFDFNPNFKSMKLVGIAPAK